MRLIIWNSKNYKTRQRIPTPFSNF